MIDFLTVWNPVTQTADIAISGADIAADSGLTSLAILYLLTDRQADPDDVLPDNSGDRRGTWTDSPVDNTVSTDAAPQLLGCRWWLLTRAKCTEATRQLLIQYAQEALHPLITSGAAAAIDVQAYFQGIGTIYGAVTIYRSTGASGTTPDAAFNFAWQATLGVTILPPS